MTRHSFAVRRQPAAFIPAPGPTPVPRTDAPFPQTQRPTQVAALADSPETDVDENLRPSSQQGELERLAMVKLTPREIEIRIGRLIHVSLNERSTAMAAEIVRHIEALCAHPDDRRSPEARCILRRLAGHWRRLAWLAVDSESEGNPIPGSTLACCQPVV